jgi:hypothetical protein
MEIQDYEVKNPLVHVFFCSIFSLSCSMFELIICEVLDLFDARHRSFFLSFLSFFLPFSVDGTAALGYLHGDWTWCYCWCCLSWWCLPTCSTSLCRLQVRALRVACLCVADACATGWLRARAVPISAALEVVFLYAFHSIRNPLTGAYGPQLALLSSFQSTALERQGESAYARGRSVLD